MNLLVFPIIAISLIFFVVPLANGESVPDWVKNTARWWADDQISETEFVNAIEFLVNDNIIQVASTTSATSSESVPDWVKNTAGWWATDAISETEFVNAIEFLVNVGIININENCKYEDQEFSHLRENELLILCEPRYTEEYFEGIVEKKDVEYELNSHSFRGLEFSAEKSEDTFRIFLIGGSTIQGWGVEKEETISHILQDELNSLKLKQKFEVINAGFGGAWSKNEVNLLKKKIITYDPDLVIVYDGWNDSLKQLGVHASFDSDATPEKWKNRWDEACELYKKENFEIIISIQPLLNENGSRIVTDEEYALLRAVGVPYHYDVLEALRGYSHMVKDFESCQNVIDLTNAFDDKIVPLFIDAGHVGYEGNKIISQKFLEHSIPIIENKLNEKITYVEKNVLRENRPDIPKNDFSGKIFENGSFIDQVISEQDFKTTYFINTKFINSIIDNSNLRYSITQGEFVNSEINDSRFPRAVLIDSEFRDSIISNTYMPGMQFKLVNFENAGIHNSNIRGSIWSEFKMESSTLEDVNLSNSVLQKLVINNSEFDSVDFFYTRFIGVNINNTTFDNTNFGYTDTAGTIFKNSQFNNVEWSNSDFSHKLQGETGPVIPGMIITGSILIGSNFDSVIFNMMEFNETLSQKEIITNKFYAVKIQNSDLSDSDMSNLDLNYVDFRNSNLSNVNMAQSSLIFANLEGANLEGANLEGANLEGANLNCLNHEICNE